MALLKTITTDSGYEASYWRIEGVANHTLVPQITRQVITVEGMPPVDSVEAAPVSPTTISMSLWKDAATRTVAKTTGGAAAIASVQYQADGVFASITDAYDHLKTLPDFADAQDA